MMTKNTADKIGILYIVATPIGNLGDITQRALETLKKVDRICAEDTRNTRKLLTHFGIQGDLQALHDHNEKDRIQQIKSWLDSGENIALVSDAGTPLISDPGYHLVNELGSNETGNAYRIEPIPGASAIITALSIAGLPTDRFTFEGFLPAKSVGRNKALQVNAKETRRELTKLYEQVFRGTLDELNNWISEDPMHQKGEFVVMLEGHIEEVESDALQRSSEELLKILVDELPVKQAANIASKITGQKKNDLYRQAMRIKNS